ncbi:hypothetical protein DPMN_031791 [Dreissena polymorpha]|uniref:LRAT domain-containing protein n=1 Tax=Dreissena polymorpha TaxID=45954 RepID=A0A9D4M0N2_DREPO|nr:hypothetical protein DPMN_031791 [Dreissena polymorpha]
MRKVANVNQLKVGDVIIYKYYKISHEGVVTNVTKLNEDDCQCMLGIIHYGTETIFSRRTIREDMKQFNLSRDSVYVKKFDEENEPDTVVQRARSRLGEQRHDIFDNSSSDFVKWAKVGMQPIKPAHDERLMVYNVYSWYDLVSGSIIEFSYYGIDHQGILTEFNPQDAQTISITVIHYGTPSLFGTRTIMEETRSINLKNTSLKIFRCKDGFHPKEPDEVIRKAKQRAGEQLWRAGNRSWDFCLRCLFGKN